jgi:hypothetical protein
METDGFVLQDKLPLLACGGHGWLEIKETRRFEPKSGSSSSS